jgi:hypothetical protein
MATMKQISAPSSSSRNVPLSLARTSIQSRWSYAGRNLGRSNDRRRPGRCRRRASTCNAQTAWEPRRSGRLPGGLWHFSKFTTDDNTVAQKFFQQAIDLDPNFAGGYWGLTWAQIGEASIFRRRNVAETLRSVEALARRAVALDGSDAEARSSLGLTLALLGDSKGGLAEIERALAISPNLASAHGALGAARPKRPYPLLSARKPKRSCARSLRRYSSGG